MPAVLEFSEHHINQKVSHRTRRVNEFVGESLGYGPRVERRHDSNVQNLHNLIVHIVLDKAYPICTTDSDIFVKI